MNKNEYKYNKILTSEQLGFLQYYMLPQKDQFQYIYRPGDDSFLMMSVLKNQCANFIPSLNICEVGSGSGILSAHLSKWLKQSNKQPSVHIATDISLDACLFSCKYYQKYNLEVQQVCTSLLKYLGPNFKPDVIICNPPYIPTDKQQKQSQIKYLKQKISAVRDKGDSGRSPNKNLIGFSYMGGTEGLDTTRSLISSVSWQSKIYLIVMGQQGLEILRSEVQSGTILSKHIKAQFQVLQFYKKINQQLYVVVITTKFC